MKPDVRERFEKLEERMDRLTQGWVPTDVLVATAERLHKAGLLRPPPPPFKFSVGQEVQSMVAFGRSAENPYRGPVVSRERDGMGNWYLVDGRNLPEAALVAVSAEPRFKVEDWVRTQLGAPGRVTKIVPTNTPKPIIQYHVIRQDGGADWYTAESLEPWVPRLGEWVIWQHDWRVSHHSIGDISAYTKPFQYQGQRLAGRLIPAPLGTHAEGWFK
jgi:hypothetical protein